MDTKCCQDKLSQCKIGGPSKPFIDQNLQIQLPDWDKAERKTESSHSPIYIHYIGSPPSSYFSSPVNESELHHAIADAERAHAAWKKIQNKLNEAVQSVRK